MFSASIEITVSTSENTRHKDPHNFWTVRLISKTGNTIKQIVEQDYLKRLYDKESAANTMLDNHSSYFDLIFGDS